MRIPIVCKNLKLLLLGFGLILVFQSGCSTNLSAVREFADISSESAEYTKLIEQYVQSFERQKRYAPERFHEQLDKKKPIREAQAKRLLARQALIEEYMDALGQLASDNIASYDKEINDLGKAVTDNKFAEQKEVEAFTTIASLLTNAVTDRWRKSQLQKIITKANGPFQVVTKTLRNIVVKIFGADVKDERTALEKYYGGILATSADAAGQAALEEWKELRMGKLDERQRAIENYGKILSKISAGHQKLYDAQGEFSKDTLITEIRRYAKDLRKLINTVRSI